MIYANHPTFKKEMDKFLKKHHQDDGWLFKLQNVLLAHFENRARLDVRVLPPVGEYKGYRLWKVYMVIGGVRKNNMPRVCFAEKDKETIIFLCFGTHINNYKTNDLIKLGKKRLAEFIGC